MYDNAGGNAISNTGSGGDCAGGGINLGGVGGPVVVIIRYKYTKIVIEQVQQTGFLNYTNTDGWLVSQPFLNKSGGTMPITLSD